MESNPRLDLPWFPVPARTFLDWRAQARSFSTLAAQDGSFADGHRIAGARAGGRAVVTPSYFPALGMTPVLGRALATDSGGPAEVVISYAYWQTRFGGTPSVLGKVLTVDGRPYTIVGVAPNGWPGDAQLWTRLSLTSRRRAQSPRSHRCCVWSTATWRHGGRGTTGTRRDPGTGYADGSGFRPGLVRRHRGHCSTTGSADVRPALVALLAAAGCVLLIGAATLGQSFPCPMLRARA